MDADKRHRDCDSPVAEKRPRTRQLRDPDSRFVGRAGPLGRPVLVLVIVFVPGTDQAIPGQGTEHDYEHDYEHQ
jgi:hypothetical protein